MMKKNLIRHISVIVFSTIITMGQSIAQDSTAIMNNLNYIAHKITTERTAPATLAKLKKQRTELKEKVLDIIGLNPMQEKTPLNIKYVGDKVDLGNCYFQRVVYESRPKVYVAAHLFIPKNVTFPVPAVIHVPGHSRRDKYRPHARTYAENGFVAIELPMVGEEGKIGAGWDACGEHAQYLGHLNWYNTGYSAAAPTIWDGIRTVDFLLTLTNKTGTKLVNQNKIGIAGLSGGSIRAMLTTIADPRISVAVVNQGVNAIEHYNKPGGISSTCDIHLFYNYYGISYGEMFSLVAPRKLLIQNGTLDKLYPNPLPVINYLINVYSLYGASDSFAYKSYEQEHAYSDPIWNAENAWMDKWLRNGNSPLTIYKERFDAELTCFPDGEPADMAHVETVFTPKTPNWNIQNKKDFKACKKTLMAALQSKIIRTAFLPINSEIKTTNKTEEQGFIVEQKQLGMNDNSIIHNGYYLYKPGEKRKTVILISKEKINLSELKSLFKSSYLPDGFNLYCTEITGTGNNPWLTDSHWKLSRFAELCGHTQASLQINDILAAIENIKTESSVNSSEIYLWGEGDLAVPALYSAVVNEKNIAGVILENAPDAHIGITPIIESNCNTALFNVLKYGNIPQVAGLIYPRTIILYGNKKSGFDWTENIYSKLSKEDNFVKLDGTVKNVLQEINSK
ncbi:MAG: hypothetical protein L3J54_07695 [Draconibacterium sp.]|nr:hypothetical protein [Draconibacterium sp.]